MISAHTLKILSISADCTSPHKTDEKELSHIFFVRSFVNVNVPTSPANYKRRGAYHLVEMRRFRLFLELAALIRLC